MSWLRLDDTFPQHPKLSGWSAAQKWALIELFTYCARHRTEGHVPADLSLLPRAVTRKVLDLAEESGILDREDDDSLVVHDWSTYNPSDPTAAERMQRMRERNAARNENRNEGRNETVSSRARLPSPTPSVANATAQALVAGYVEASRALGVDPPRRTVGQVARQVGELLNEGQPPDAVGAALGLMVDKRLNPATLPSLLLEAVAGPARRQNEQRVRHEPPVEEALDLPEISEEERLANLERLKAMTA